MFSVSKSRHAFPTGPTLKLHAIEGEGEQQVTGTG